MSLLPSWPISLVPARAGPSRHGLARVVWNVPDGPRTLGDAPPRKNVPNSPAAPLRIELLAPVDAARHRDAWVALTRRTLEPNVFLDPDFALPAAQHLAPARTPDFILVWAAGRDGSDDLVALCAVVGRPDPLRALASAWLHDLSTLGIPLLDRERGAEALAALLLWAEAGLPGARGLVIGAVPSDGPTAALLHAVAASAGRRLAVLGSWERAVLRRGGDPMRAGLSARGVGLSAKGAKELRRQRRRLAEQGEVSRASARRAGPLRDAVEGFLALEAAGWKGAAGTALLARPGLVAFARTATRLLGRRGLCRVESLLLDGLPVAAVVILTAGEADFLWKIAYREDVARFSPGVQLVFDLTEAEDRAAITDSCAVPNHPMIDRLWRDRMRLSDVAVATCSGAAPGFRLAVAAERGARHLRAGAKRVLLGWRARRAAAIPPEG